MTQLRLVIILAGIALLTGLSLWAGLPAIGRAFGAVGVDGFGLVVLIHVPLIALLGAAWWSIGRTNPRAVLPSFIAARLARDSVAELLPFSQLGGFAAGVHVLSLTGIPARQGARSLFADLLMEFFAKLPYAMAGLVLLVWLRPQSAVPSYLLLTLAVLAGVPLLLWLLRDVLLRFVPQGLHHWVGVQAETPGLRSLLVLQDVAPSGVLHALCWALGGLEAWVTLRLMGISVTPVEALAIDSLVTSLRTFGFFMPAALGVQEAAYVLVCDLFGLSPGEAMAFSLVRRARDVLLGLIGLALWQTLEVRRARRPISFA
ncbi:MAG TPA: lysylphosphatidylglycerol synthase domain-containing protein [Rhizomicrobium sp.]|nr:lysylphosphatidylglycerol synthase domain-containing protein [Rhizomicrobium sp.]